MSIRKNLTLVFNHFEQEHLGKDVFLVPYYLGQQLGYEVSIVYEETKTNINFPNEIKGVKLVPKKLIGNENTHFYIRNYRNLKYIAINAKKIDLLMCFHHTALTELRVCLYKFFNPNGKVYVKLDLDKLKKTQESTNIIKRWFWRKILNSFLNKVDLLSCETTQVYNQLKDTDIPSYQYGNKLLLMPNGFDEEQLKFYHLKEKEFDEKENLFITVARLGTPQKNTEMILEAISKIDMRDWKFLLIGPIEDSFQNVIKEFYKSNPDKKESIIFTGPIYEKKELWEYYNRAKVFVLTSRWEGSPIVFPEAKRFRNYILSTNVGGFNDITENRKYGDVLEQNQPELLALKLQNIINGTIETNVYNNFNPIKISWEKQIELISNKLK